MQKPLALTIAACLGLTGCHVFEKSETWSQVVSVRPGEAAFDPDPSHAYAAKLHAALAARGVEHKVVVYQYHYTTRLNEEALGTRTAVVYRDDTDASYPWWLKDERVNNPFWLPNGDLNKQISFYIRRNAEVIETKDYPARGGSGKMAVALAQAAPAPRTVARPQPQEPVTRITPFKKAPAPVVAPKSVPTTELVKAPAKAPAASVAKVTEESAPKATVTHIKPPASSLASHRTTAPETAPAPIASKGNGSVLWAPPSVLDSREQSALTAPRDEHLEKLFRAKHGSEYNRFSPIDRRKMQQLQHEIASRD